MPRARLAPFVTRTLLPTLIAALSAGHAAANSFTITPASNFSSWNIAIDGANAAANPDLTLYTGETYTFTVTASGTHPFWIKTVRGIGSGNGYAGTGLSANGVTSSTTITFNVPDDAPATLFYDCANHSLMSGTITVIPNHIFTGNFE